MANIGEGYSCPKGKGSVLVLGQAKLGLRDTYFRPEGSYSRYGAANIKYIHVLTYFCWQRRGADYKEKKKEKELGLANTRLPPVLLFCLFVCFLAFGSFFYEFFFIYLIVYLFLTTSEKAHC